jgi:hypothetical protein
MIEMLLEMAGETFLDGIGLVLEYLYGEAGQGGGEVL